MKTRKANREVLRNNIIKISRKLFLEQGYENTTVRQVLKRGTSVDRKSLSLF